MWLPSLGWAFLPVGAIVTVAVALAVAYHRSGAVTTSRIAVGLLAAWALVATTALVAIVAGGGWPAIGRFARSPVAYLQATPPTAWLWGAAGAFALFALAFAFTQLVGRGYLRLLRPWPLPWPVGLPAPATPTRLLAFPSERADAMMFTLIERVGRLRVRPVDLILVSDRLLRLLSATEWEAVVAHEIGHGRGLDGRYLTFVRTFSRMMRWDPIFAYVSDSLTRHEELRADAVAVELTGRPRALARAIYKASRIAPARPGISAAFLGTGGRRGQADALARIERLVALAESGRFPEERGA